MAMRMAVRPAHRLSSVKTFGTSMRTGILLWRNSSRRRRRRSSTSSLGSRGSMASSPFATCCRLLNAGLALRLLGSQIGQHRLAADRALTDGDQRTTPRRQIDIDTRSEANQAEPLAHAHALAL